jgi:hypothetical protein
MISEEGVPVRGSMRDTDKPAALDRGARPRRSPTASSLARRLTELGVSGCLRFEIFAGL